MKTTKALRWIAVSFLACVSAPVGSRLFAGETIYPSNACDDPNMHVVTKSSIGVNVALPTAGMSLSLQPLGIGGSLSGTMPVVTLTHGAKSWQECEPNNPNSRVAGVRCPAGREHG